MEINNLNAATAYANTPAATPPSSTSQLNEQNTAASNAQLDQRTVDAVQEAFEVTITQEAQTLRAQEAQTTEASAAEQAATETQSRTTQPESQNQNSIEPAADASQVINIVA